MSWCGSVVTLRFVVFVVWVLFLMFISPTFSCFRDSIAFLSFPGTSSAASFLHLLISPSCTVSVITPPSIQSIHKCHGFSSHLFNLTVCFLFSCPVRITDLDMLCFWLFSLHSLIRCIVLLFLLPHQHFSLIKILVLFLFLSPKFWVCQTLIKTDPSLVYFAFCPVVAGDRKPVLVTLHRIKQGTENVSSVVKCLTSTLVLASLWLAVGSSV